jgi:hypothetical protein
MKTCEGSDIKYPRTEPQEDDSGLLVALDALPPPARLFSACQQLFRIRNALRQEQHPGGDHLGS